MMKDAVESDPTTSNNYRGMVVTDRSPLLKLDTGDTFMLPPSSFSPSFEVAQRFQIGGVLQPFERLAAIEESAVFGYELANVTFVLERDAKVSASGAILDDPAVLADDSQFVPFEVVANGEFQVTSKAVWSEDPRGVPEYVIYLRHLSTFDPFEGEYVEVNEQRTFGWQGRG